MEKTHCKKLLVYPQFTGTCWFNALLMSLFYSEGMHNLLLKVESSWNMSMKLKKTLKDILQRRSTNYVSKEAAYAFFKIVTPEYILQLLHKENPKIFSFDAAKHIGYVSTMYLPRLMELLGIDNKLHLDAVVNTDGTYNLYTSNTYRSYEIKPVDKNKKATNYFATYMDSKKVVIPESIFDIITIRVVENETYKGSDALYRSNVELKNNMYINGIEYIYDSVILGNFNSKVCKKAHEIAGITCNKKRFLYNGWISTTIDSSMLTNEKRTLNYPCELIEYDWLQNDSDFCLNPKKCNIKDTIPRSNKHDLCFNVHKGNRTYILVNKKYASISNKRKSVYSPPHPSPRSNPESPLLLPSPINPPKPLKEKQKKECPPDKIRNPKSGRCVKKDGAIGKRIILGEQKEKDCPPGKIRNPKTGRCVKRDGIIGKNIKPE